MWKHPKFMSRQWDFRRMWEHPNYVKSVRDSGDVKTSQRMWVHPYAKAVRVFEEVRTSYVKSMSVFAGCEDILNSYDVRSPDENILYQVREGFRGYENTLYKFWNTINYVTASIWVSDQHIIISRQPASESIGGVKTSYIRLWEFQRMWKLY